MSCKFYTRARLKPVSPEIWIQMITYYDAGGPFTVEQFLAISQNAKTAPPNDLRQESKPLPFQRERQIHDLLKKKQPKKLFGDIALVLQKYRKGI